MARPDFPRTLAEFQGRFASEEDCRRYLVACRWPDGFRCPRCGEGDACELATRNLLQCRSCRHQVSVTAGTVLHRARVVLGRETTPLVLLRHDLLPLLVDLPYPGVHSAGAGSVLDLADSLQHG